MKIEFMDLKAQYKSIKSPPFLNSYTYLDYEASDFPVMNRLKDEILSLPIHGSMTDEEVDYVIDSVRSR